MFGDGILAFSLDNRYLAFSDAHSIFIYDVDGGSLVRKWNHYPRRRIGDICYFPKRQLIGILYPDSQSISFYDYISGEGRGSPIFLKEKSVEKIECSPDGKGILLLGKKGLVSNLEISPFIDKIPYDSAIQDTERLYGLKLDGLDIVVLGSRASKNLHYNTEIEEPDWLPTHPYYWTARAQKGDDTAMVMSGILYDKNNEYDKALKWYQKAAAAGNTNALFRLEQLVRYLSEQRPQNRYAEKIWLSKAEHGDHNAMLQLGIIHDRAKDIENAMIWYEKAATAGNEVAKEKIEILKQWEKRREINRVMENAQHLLKDDDYEKALELFFSGL